MCCWWRAPANRSNRSMTPSRRRRHGDPHPAEPGPRPEGRRTRPGAVRALRPARRAGRQRRHSREIVAAAAYPVRALGPGHGRQRHGQLAADPHARSAAPPLGGRAGDLRHLVRRSATRPRLLGPLLRVESRARMPGQDLRQRDERQRDQGEPDRPGRDRDAHAGRGLSRRGPGNIAHARAGGRELPCPRPARLHNERGRPWTP